MNADVLRRIIAGVEARAFERIEDYWRVYADDVAGIDSPVARAALGGAMADRLGYAFAAGYAAALCALLPAARDTPTALAATEADGVHPKAIKAVLVPDRDGWRLSGHKTWVTGVARSLLVLAKQRDGDDAPLVVVRVETERSGVDVRPLPAMAFVPEIPHAEVILSEVPITAGDILPGDGWGAWVKPFRTVEDIHVHAALLGYLASAGGRYKWPRILRQRLASLLMTFDALAGLDASAESTHVALAGALAEVAAIIETMGLHITLADEGFRTRWQRDRPLLQVAARARVARLDKAWERLG